MDASVVIGAQEWYVSSQIALITAVASLPHVQFVHRVLLFAVSAFMFVFRGLPILRQVMQAWRGGAADDREQRMTVFAFAAFYCLFSFSVWAALLCL